MKQFQINPDIPHYLSRLSETCPLILLMMMVFFVVTQCPCHMKAYRLVTLQQTYNLFRLSYGVLALLLQIIFFNALDTSVSRESFYFYNFKSLLRILYDTMLNNNFLFISLKNLLVADSQDQLQIWNNYRR